MKKIAAFFLAIIFIVCFSGCGIPFTAKKIIDESEIYSERDIEKAMNAVYCEFAGFEGCVLLELEYDEEYSKERADDWAENYGADEAIVLLSKFYVAAENGSLTPGKTYSKWNWILVRNNNGPWKLMTWGYG
ncbi:MAG: hypothetical protein IKL57_05450 [Oscillospiraceae bacterium]|nr:hypothetical protein [Oscillospiraceae bacterium]MBR3610894.1 hypothetical protein [Oscillospiraceae bacterium]MBR3953391.1 hypothetical protein [Oscillospiraceae bacterium]